jgi:aromatic ring-opening dioxygenase catalytic subunit (LigB family)
MFPDDDGVFELPVVEVSVSSDLRPETEYEIGKALKALRYVLSAIAITSLSHVLVL